MTKLNVWLWALTRSTHCLGCNPSPTTNESLSSLCLVDFKLNNKILTTSNFLKDYYVIDIFYLDHYVWIYIFFIIIYLFFYIFFTIIYLFFLTKWSFMDFRSILTDMTTRNTASHYIKRFSQSNWTRHISDLLFFCDGSFLHEWCHG